MIIPHLQQLEKDFFELVGYGNVAYVKDFLEIHPDFNINVMDFQVRFM